MTRQPRRNHSPALKAKVAVAAIKGEKTLIELAQDFDVHLLPAGHVHMPERRTRSSSGAISYLRTRLVFLGKPRRLKRYIACEVFNIIARQNKLINQAQIAA